MRLRAQQLARLAQGVVPVVAKKKKKAAKVVARKKPTTKAMPAKKKAKKKAAKRPRPIAAIASGKGNFKPGHQLWKRRLIDGKPRLYETPEQLINACCEYFQWVEDNPLLGEIQCSFEGVFTHDKTPKIRAMTQKALALHIGVSFKTWQNYGHKDHELSEVCEWANNVIFTQKYEGAAAGFFNSNLVIRDLGINDTSKLVTDDGKGGTAPLPNLSLIHI